MKGDNNEENQQSTNRVLSVLQMVRIHQHAKCQAIPRCILREMPGNHKLDFCYAQPWNKVKIQVSCTGITFESPCIWYPYSYQQSVPQQWRHNERNGVSHHQRLHYLLNRLFARRSKKTWKLRVTGLCEGNSPVTGEFPTQRASNAEMFPFDDAIMKHRKRTYHLFLDVLFVFSYNRK